MDVAIYIYMKIYGDFFIIFLHFNCLFRLKTGYLERGQASRLVIDNVTYDYQGEYECRATNQINGQERTVASEPVSLQVVGECTFSSFFFSFSRSLLSQFKMRTFKAQVNDYNIKVHS